MPRHYRQDPPAPPKHSPLIFVLTFDPDEEGETRPSTEPLKQRSEAQAKVTAIALSYKRAGVIAWKRSALPDQGEFGPPEILFQRGQVPEIE